MIFNILVVVFIAIIAYFHFVQGFFSSAISAVIAVISAVLAVSYDETVVAMVNRGGLADEAHAVVLCAIFAVSYTILRVLFDKLIPGNVRTPSTVDKVGAALMGVIAGVYAVGVLAIAIQMLPMGPTLSFLGYDRYKTEPSAQAIVPVENGSNLDATLNDRLESPAEFKEDDSNFRPLWMHVDDIVIGTVERLSNKGSLAGDRPLSSVHPNYLQELFGERLGQQNGGQRSAVQFKNKETLSVVNVFSPESQTLTGYDFEPTEIRGGKSVTTLKGTELPKKDKDAPKIMRYEIKPGPGEKLLVVRIKVDEGASVDTDHVFRFSCGSMHLVVKQGDTYKNVYPIGTLENSKTVLLNALDDFLMITPGDKSSFDAVFKVDSSVIAGGQVAKGTFIVVKRFALMDLSEKEVKPAIDPLPKNGPIRTKVMTQRLALKHDDADDVVPPDTQKKAVAKAKPTEDKPTEANNTTNTETPATPETPKAVEVDFAPHLEVGTGTVPFGIGVKIDGPDQADIKVPCGVVSIKGNKIATAQVEPLDTAAALATGGPTEVHDLFVPEGKTAVQVSAGFADIDSLNKALSSLVLLDSNGNDYHPNGYFVKATSGDKSGWLFDYHFEVPRTAVAATVPVSADEKRVTFIFLVPENTKAATLRAGAKQGPVN